MLEPSELEAIIKAVTNNVVEALKEKETNEETPKKKRGRPKKAAAKKKATPKKEEEDVELLDTPAINAKKLKEEPWRKTFVDNLEEESDLIDADQQTIKRKKRRQKQPRQEKVSQKKCQRCQKTFDNYGGEYLCRKCMGI